LSLHESKSSWILEAALPERDAQEFRLAFEDDQNPPVATMTSMPQIQLPVHLLRGTQPRIDSSQAAEAFTGSNSAVLRMRFELDAASLPSQIAVAGATARISIPIGRGPLIWALGKDFAHKVWSRVQLWI
jgi:uroporphyrinogen-III decarboxylase